MIITLTGPNDFEIKQTLTSLIKSFEQKYGADGIERYVGESLEPSQLPTLLQGGSLFSNHKLVVIQDASQNKMLWEALQEWTQNVPEDTVLIIAEAKLDKRTKTYKSLAKHSDFREFATLDEHKLGAWVQKQAQQHGAAINSTTTAYVIARVGNDQWQLSNELQKLAQYTGGQEITKDAIDTLVDRNPQASAFDLLDAALAGKNDRLQTLLKDLKVNEDPYRLFGLIVSQVHTLAIVISAKNKPADAIAKEGGLHPFAVRKTQAQARQITPKRLKFIIGQVATLDDRLKSSGADPWILLEQCLHSIASYAKIL